MVATRDLPLRLVFMATASFAVPSLEALARSRHALVKVYTQPPRPAGRGLRARPAPVELAARRLGLPVPPPPSPRWGSPPPMPQPRSARSAWPRDR